MAQTDDPARKQETYALGIAQESYDWYKAAAIRSRRLYKMGESALVVTSAAIPTTAIVVPGNSVAPGILGAVVVVLSGLRAVFHWQENYLRFSAAREAVEQERRQYGTQAKPYDDPGTRAQLLVAAVTRIEQIEMKGWMRVATQRPKAE
jgi:hypothetical protein